MDPRKGLESQRGGARHDRGNQGRLDNTPRLELIPIPRTQGNPFGFDTVSSDNRVTLAHHHPLNLELASTRHEMRLRHNYWTAPFQDIPEEMGNQGYDYQRRHDAHMHYNERIEDLLRRNDFVEQGIPPIRPPPTMAFRPAMSGAEPGFRRSALTSAPRRQDQIQDREWVRENQQAILNPAFEPEISNLNPTSYSAHPILRQQPTNMILERQARGTLWTPDAQAAAVDSYHRLMQSGGRGASLEPEAPRAFSPLFFEDDNDLEHPFPSIEYEVPAKSNHRDAEMSGLAAPSGPRERQVEPRRLTTGREQEEPLSRTLVSEAAAERIQQWIYEVAFHEAEADVAFHEAEPEQEKERLRLSAIVTEQISSDMGTNARPHFFMQPTTADLTAEAIVQPVPTDAQSRSTGGQFQNVDEVVLTTLPSRPVFASSKTIFTVESLERDAGVEFIPMPATVRLPPVGSQSQLAEEGFERVRNVPGIQASTPPTSEKHLPFSLRNIEPITQHTQDELLVKDPVVFSSRMSMLSNAPEARLSDEAIISRTADLATPGLPAELAEPEPASLVKALVVRPRVRLIHPLMRATALAALETAEADPRKAAASHENKAASTRESRHSTVAGPQKRKLESIQEIPRTPEVLANETERPYKSQRRGTSKDSSIFDWIDYALIADWGDDD